MNAIDPVETALSAFPSALQAEIGRVANQFPQDVVIAARTAAELRVALSVPGDVAAEPWPPMQMRMTA